MMNKHYADLRIKIGAKKQKNQLGFGHILSEHVPSKLNDYDSIPSDIGGDQWAEIQNYDYNQYLKEQQMQRNNEIRKRQMVKDTLDR